MRRVKGAGGVCPCASGDGWVDAAAGMREDESSVQILAIAAPFARGHSGERVAAATAAARELCDSRERTRRVRYQKQAADAAQRTPASPWEEVS